MATYIGAPGLQINNLTKNDFFKFKVSFIKSLATQSNENERENSSAFTQVRDQIVSSIPQSIRSPAIRLTLGRSLSFNPNV